ncbi:MAG: acetoacetate decarboxylase family protein [Polyangiaceae bacterium]|nr:acetoacetate decarboxylase family protein [Polyangiaceae bacterium]
MVAERPYPDPPWETSGFALGVPAAVPSASVELPSSLEPVAFGGRTLGQLLYVEYRPPSPLVYDELVWMPSLVRPRGAARGRSAFVAVMYVSTEASLRGGRELWRLPKSLATFQREGDRVRVRAEDGTRLELRVTPFGPGFDAPLGASTLQPDGDRLVRFRGRGSGRGRVARVAVERFETTHPPWASLEAARLAPLGVALSPFRSTMLAPAPAGRAAQA